MSAHLIFAQIPLGSMVGWTDGAPRPPERHRRKLSAWKTNNSSGRLIRKKEDRTFGNVFLPANFVLHEGDFDAGSIAIRIHRTFSLDSNLRFYVLERPAIGSVRVFDRTGEDAELVHLASDRAAAQEWLTRHGYPHAVLEEVTADEIAAVVVEGRTAA